VSDSQTPSFQPTGAPKKRRSSSALVWFLVVVLALAAFVGAIIYAGGFGQVLTLTGLDDAFSGLFNSSGSASVTATAGAATTPPASTTTTTSGSGGAAASELGIPDEALEQMYKEQLQSQENLKRLVDGEVTTLELGTADVSGDTAYVPVTVSFTDGTRLSGQLHLERFSGKWYFYSIRANATRSDDVSYPDGIDEDVVSTIVEQQATDASQDYINRAILQGGFDSGQISAVKKGSGTAKVELTLSGGPMDQEKSQFVLVRKVAEGSTYWFVARVESL